jgi:N-acetylmuramoyl-L-alanine amidase
MRKINKIILHCSATKEGKHFTAKDIDQWHRRRGYRKIGYHYVILLDGTVEHGRGLEEVGAHTLHHNAHSIGICYIGGLDEEGNSCDTRTPAQRIAMKKLIDNLLVQYPNATVHCHNEFANKDCPCFNIEDL